jgi:S1-C subfamily serine protease
MKKLFLFFILIIIFVVSFLNLQSNSNQLAAISNFNQQKINLSQEDISNLTKPTIVKIVTQQKANITVPFFDIDWEKMDLIFPEREPFLIEGEEYVNTGTGFVINDNGYIATNAHIVSENVFKRSIAQKLIGLRFLKVVDNKDDQIALEKISLNNEWDELDYENLGKKMAEEFSIKLVEKIKMQILEKKITVLDPSYSASQLSELLAKGFTAEEVYVNHDFYKDQKDVAIIKIQEFSLPTVNFVESQSEVEIGSKIFVYGFPSSAEFGMESYTEPTFTSGVINGLKDSQSREFKLIQTDAKISTGSSGSPIFNERGEVIGILTVLLNADLGDSFAFAVPIELIKGAIEENNIDITQSNYLKFFRNGLLHFKNNQCKMAIQNFEEVLLSNRSFNIETHVRPYINKCSALISAGNSLDTPTDHFKKFLTDNKNLVPVFIIGAVIIFLLLILILVLVIKRNKKNVLSTKTEKLSENKLLENNIQKPIIEQTPEQKLAQYIQEARKLNSNDAQIAIELKRAGWSEEKIQNAIKNNPR